VAESSVRNTFLDKLRQHYGKDVMATKIEDKFGVGIPDAVMQVRGRGTFWVEFKELDALPKRDETPVRIKFRPGQTTWLENWKSCGGNSLLCVRIQDEKVWMMFDSNFKTVESGVPLRELVNLCYWRCGTLLFPNCLPQ